MAETTDQSPFAAELAAAEADVARLRAENAKLADEFRGNPTDEGREILKRAAASLAAARDRVEAATTALAIFEKTGSEHGLLAKDGRVVGSVAVRIAPGASSQEREKAINEVLSAELSESAMELGVVLAAAPERFTRERPGRDAEGRTILEISGRVEGDTLVPAVSKSARLRRT
jgi:hexokinase